jgi:hypothetical protein
MPQLSLASLPNSVTRQHEQTTQALVDDFQQRTGATVEVKSDDEASLAGQLLQEGAASPPTCSSRRIHPR